MYSYLKKISTVGMPHEEWLYHRSKSIGGSDAASILGMNEFVSPYTVWADKLGMIPPKEDNESMRQGRDFEDYVAKRFCEATGKKVRRENNIIINPDYPFAHANIDRMVIGEDAGLECKTTSVLNMRKFKNGEYPANYYVQCVHYMMVTGAKKWYLGVLVFGRQFMWFEIERDEDEIEALAKSEAEFWKFVEAKEPPTPDGTSSTTDTISAIYPESNSETVNLFAYESELKQYVALTDQIKELEKLKDEMANRVKDFLGKAGKGETDRYRVSWASMTRSTFDSKRFAQDHSDIDLSDYYKTSTYRTFKVNEINN